MAGFTPAGDLRLSNGWVLDRDFSFLSHGYVSTSHASQGRTTQIVIVAASAASLPATGSDTTYVALTRATERAALWTDDLAGFRAAAARDRRQANAHDLVTPGPADRPSRTLARAGLARRLAEVARVAADYVRERVLPRELAHER